MYRTTYVSLKHTVCIHSKWGSHNVTSNLFYDYIIYNVASSCQQSNNLTRHYLVPKREKIYALIHKRNEYFGDIS